MWSWGNQVDTFCHYTTLLLLLALTALWPNPKHLLPQKIKIKNQSQVVKKFVFVLEKKWNQNQRQHEKSKQMRSDWQIFYWDCQKPTGGQCMSSSTRILIMRYWRGKASSKFVWGKMLLFIAVFKKIGRFYAAFL